MCISPRHALHAGAWRLSKPYIRRALKLPGWVPGVKHLPRGYEATCTESEHEELELTDVAVTVGNDAEAAV